MALVPGSRPGRRSALALCWIIASVPVAGIFSAHMLGRVWHTMGLRGILAILGPLHAVVGAEAGPQPAAPSVVGNTNKPRAEVFAVQDPAATAAFVPNPSVVRRLVERGLIALADTADITNAWRALIRTNDVVGFKVTSAAGEMSGTRPAVVKALVETLLAAGHPAKQIVIWDKRTVDLRQAGWQALAASLGVRCRSSEEAGWDPNPDRAYEKPVIGRLVAGDLEFDQRQDLNAGRRSHVTRLLTQELTVVIPVTPALAHNLAGVNGQLVGLALGSIDNSLRFQNNPALLAEAVPEICALDDLLARVVFGVSDALTCQYRGEESLRLYDTVVLNELRFSRDPLALDALAVDDIVRAHKASPYAVGKIYETDLYVNAELLELGVSDLKRIDVKKGK